MRKALLVILITLFAGTAMAQFCYNQAGIPNCFPKTGLACPSGTVEVTSCPGTAKNICYTPTGVPKCFPKTGSRCPDGTTAVTVCPAPPTPTPTPGPIVVDPSVHCVASVQLVQTNDGAVLLVDGRVIRTWGIPGQTKNQWQTNFSWTAVPMISGGR